jgi:hypothetical protein
MLQRNFVVPYSNQRVFAMNPERDDDLEACYRADCEPPRSSAPAYTVITLASFQLAMFDQLIYLSYLRKIMEMGRMMRGVNIASQWLRWMEIGMDNSPMASRPGGIAG